MGGIGTYLYASGKPLSKIDEKGLVDVWVWMPLPYEGGRPSYGKLHSSFGHISTTSNGVDYSFGPAGNSISTNYVSSQLNLRTGIKHTIELTPQQESKQSACLARPQGEYSAINNNCGTPLQNCMREIGKELQPVNMILPESINHLLWWMSDDSTIQRGKR